VESVEQAEQVTSETENCRRMKGERKEEEEEEDDDDDDDDV
jgi:hypothetical protein